MYKFISPSICSIDNDKKGQDRRLLYMKKSVKKNWKFLQSSFSLLLALTLVFSSFSFVFAYENGTGGSYDENYSGGLLQDDDRYANDDDEVACDYDEYNNDEVVYDSDEYAQDYLPQEAQEVEAAEFGAGIMPAWGWMPIQENRLYVGMHHSFVIRPDNSLWGWGFNWYGVLGNDTAWNDVNPNPTKIMDNVAAISTGSNHTMAITTDGNLWGWGNNQYGQLGDGSFQDHHSPVWIKSNVAAVSVGWSHTMVITMDGSLWGWGSNQLGQLGDGTFDDRHSPIWIMDNVMAVSAGNRHTAALMADGSLWSWGNNGNGQLGDGTRGNQRHSPVWVMDNVDSVSASGNYTMAITTDGDLWGWGSNEVGQLGDGTTADSYSPVWIMDNVVTVSARNSPEPTAGGHTMVIRADDSLWSWGHNTFGQLGNGTRSWFGIPHPNPVKIMENVAEVSAGFENTLVITTDGCLWAWGANWIGNIGNGTVGGYFAYPELIECHTSMDNTPVDPHKVAFRIIEFMEVPYCCKSGQERIVNSPPLGHQFWLSNYQHFQRVWGLGDWTFTSDGYIFTKVQHGDYFGHDNVSSLKHIVSQIVMHAGVGPINGFRDITPGRPDWTFCFRDWFRYGTNFRWDMAGVTVYEPLTFAAMWEPHISLFFDLDGGYSDQLEGMAWKYIYNWNLALLWHPNVSLEDFMPVNAWGDRVSLSDPQRDGYHFVGWYWVECGGRCPGLMLSSEEVTQMPLYCWLFSFWSCNTCWIRYYRNNVLKFTAIWEPTAQGNTPDPDRNLTHYYATMTASSSFNPNTTPPQNTNDNNTTANLWRPAAPGSGYLTARFNEAKNFNQIRIYQNGNRIRDYQLKYSNDGVTWNILHAGTATPAFVSTYPFSNTITAQYVRLVIGHSLNDNPAAVFQFDIRYMP